MLGTGSRSVGSCYVCVSRESVFSCRLQVHVSV